MRSYASGLAVVVMEGRLVVGGNVSRMGAIDVHLRALPRRSMRLRMKRPPPYFADGAAPGNGNNDTLRVMPLLIGGFACANLVIVCDGQSGKRSGRNISADGSRLSLRSDASGSRVRPAICLRSLFQRAKRSDASRASSADVATAKLRLVWSGRFKNTGAAPSEQLYLSLGSALCFGLLLPNAASYAREFVIRRRRHAVLH